MDPYDILGISYNSSWKDIRKAYKNMLVQTHPDKMGNAKYFMMVHEAYATIEKQFKQSQQYKNYPKEKQKYSAQPNQHQAPRDKFNLANFNATFDRYAKLYNQTDPYLNGGYKTEPSLSYQEDDIQLQQKKVKIPKRELVIYKEPEALVSSSLMDSVQHLGLNEVKDYTCRSGTDYMRAYSEEAEIIDNRPQYKNMDHLKHARANQNFSLSQEDRRLQEELEYNRQKLEQMRLRNVQKNDRMYAKIDSMINNRLL